MLQIRSKKYVYEGEYVAEVELVVTEEGWSPYLSLDDAYKLDDVRQGDVRAAAKRARVFRLEQVST